MIYITKLLFLATIFLKVKGRLYGPTNIFGDNRIIFSDRASSITVMYNHIKQSYKVYRSNRR